MQPLRLVIVIFLPVIFLPQRFGVPIHPTVAVVNEESRTGLHLQ